MSLAVGISRVFLQISMSLQTLSSQVVDPVACMDKRYYYESGFVRKVGEPRHGYCRKAAVGRLQIMR